MYNYNLDVSYNNLSDYQEVFFMVFGTNNWDEELIANKRFALYEELKKEKVFDDLFKVSCDSNSLFDNADTEWGIVRLFAYDTFHLLHKCIQTYFSNNKNICESIVLTINEIEKIVKA
ncbi:MAG: hypothetical protein CMF80_06985 [Candidatus Marinimicrobia bacterium]|nr:hypothetical protein [Candidatus Neomarinimicrobiota bacterium]|tara:strand:- start:84 stop:437 length:354 start_codon:yes stop_codon:yes gene_type:complete